MGAGGVGPKWNDAAGPFIPLKVPSEVQGKAAGELNDVNNILHIKTVVLHSHVLDGNRKYRGIVISLVLLKLFPYR